jgi:hypothetical protein
VRGNEKGVKLLLITGNIAGVLIRWGGRGPMRILRVEREIRFLGRLCAGDLIRGPAWLLVQNGARDPREDPFLALAGYVTAITLPGGDSGLTG